MTCFKLHRKLQSPTENRFPNLREAVLTTFLTIDSSGTRGNSGTVRFEKHGIRSRKHQKRTDRIRKKFLQFFGSRRPWVQVPQPGPKPPVFRTKTGGFDILERLFFVYSATLFESEFHIAYAFSAATLRAFRYFPCMQSNPCSLINHKERDSPSLQICHCFPSRIIYASPYNVVFPSSSMI